MRLIVNGDDFGITHGCNLALIDCFKKGIMTSTSMMTNMPYAQEAARLWKENPDLSVGLHFCLTVGKPLTKEYSFIKKDGTFDKAILCQQKGIHLDEIRNELQVQYDRFVELNGCKPDHFNSHHGIEQIPGCGEILEEFSHRYDIPLRAFLNREDWAEYDTSFEGCPIRLIRNSAAKGPIAPEDLIALFEMEDLESDRAYELAAHPGYVDYDLLQLSSLTNGRAYDAHNFMSEQLKDWIDENKIERITFRDLKRSSGSHR